MDASEQNGGALVVEILRSELTLVIRQGRQAGIPDHQQKCLEFTARMFKEPENDGRREGNAWSPGLVSIIALTTIIIVLIAQINFGVMIVSIILIFFGFYVILFWFLFDILKRRWRRALSIATAIMSALGIIYYTRLIAQDKDEIAFYARRAEFEHQVEDARAKRTTHGPLQIVVDYKDESVFVTTNSFYYVIYDETAGAGPYEARFWTYDKSPTGVIAVAVPSKIRHLGGYFYSFRTSY